RGRHERLTAEGPHERAELGGPPALEQQDRASVETGWRHSAVLAARAAHVVAQQDRLGDFLLRPPPLPALLLNREVRLLLGDPEVALQDRLRAVDQLALLEPFREGRVLVLEPRHLDLGADEEADRRDRLDLLARVDVRIAVLEVDDADELAAAE